MDPTQVTLVICAAAGALSIVSVGLAAWAAFASNPARLLARAEQLELQIDQWRIRFEEVAQATERTNESTQQFVEASLERLDLAASNADRKRAALRTQEQRAEQKVEQQQQQPPDEAQLEAQMIQRALAIQ